MNYREMIVVDVADINEEVWRQFNTAVDTRDLFWSGYYGTGYKYLDFTYDEEYEGFDPQIEQDSRERNLVRCVLRDIFPEWGGILVDLEW